MTTYSFPLAWLILNNSLSPENNLNESISPFAYSLKQIQWQYTSLTHASQQWRRKTFQVGGAGVARSVLVVLWAMYSKHL